MLKTITEKKHLLLLLLAFVISGAMKIVNIHHGAPFVTIDDNTSYEGGFLVWFGQAAPQRMYLESWVSGLVCLSTFVVKTLLQGQGLSALNVNLVADAFRDYYVAPDLYVHMYRWAMWAFDLTTAWFVYLTARQVLKNRWQQWGPVFVATLYLFSYNTVWSDLVARPDTLVAFFGIIGLYFYFKSDFGDHASHFLAAAVFLGCAAGMKLHGAFFVIFLVGDLMRVHGIWPGLRRAVPLIALSVLFFAVTAGIPIFDPLLYVKLRMLNYVDDHSLWITWGDHFITILSGTGWLVLPLVLVTAWMTLRPRHAAPSQQAASVAFQSICWLVLFCLIRPLRAYWMLPVLPLFYMAAVYALSQAKSLKWTAGYAAALLIVLSYQSFAQVAAFHRVDFNSLRRWVVANVKPDEPIYILGYEALGLPRNTQCIQHVRQGLEKIQQIDLDKDLSFTVRHVKNWEERSALMLLDMLNFKNDAGYAYYSYYKTPLDSFQGIISLDQMTYLFVQQYFQEDHVPGLADYIEKNFIRVAQLTGPGGGGRGLSYDIYKRKIAP